MAKISNLKKRMATIASTQKITQAMKLVSLSKLQTYRLEKGDFDVYFQTLTAISQSFLGTPTSENTMRPSLYFIVMPDLGLCSAYTQGMQRILQAELHPEDVLYCVGTQEYDLLAQRYQMLNEKCSSEHFDRGALLKTWQTYRETYQIKTIVAEYKNALSLEFKVYQLEVAFSEGRDNVIYEPDYQNVVQAVIEQALEALLKYTYLTSKVSEHTTRRIAMEKAGESADEMLTTLERQYNRYRQEAITQEIAEIVSGMEV